MNNEELLNRVGIALIAAGHALAGTQKTVTPPAELQKPVPTTKVEATVEAAPAEEKPKRKRRTKAEIAASEAGEETATEVVEETATQTEVEEITEDVLKKALVAFAKKHNDKSKAFAVLGKYNAKKVADLDPNNYAEVYKEVSL